MKVSYFINLSICIYTSSWHWRENINWIIQIFIYLFVPWLKTQALNISVRPGSPGVIPRSFIIDWSFYFKWITDCLIHFNWSIGESCVVDLPPSVLLITCLFYKFLVCLIDDLSLFYWLFVCFIDYLFVLLIICLFDWLLVCSIDL